MGAAFDPQRARAIAEDAIRAAAEVKNHPPDLINGALDLLVRESLELPGFSTLDEIAARVRAQVNTALFERITSRMVSLEAHRINALLEVVGRAGKSPFNPLKQAAGRASWPGFREQVAHLAWVDSLGKTDAWLEGVAESKIADFAGEAQAADAAVMGDVAQPKRTALLVCLVHLARRRGRDDLAEMFCKRVASIIKPTATLHPAGTTPHQPSCHRPPHGRSRTEISVGARAHTYPPIAPGRLVTKSDDRPSQPT